jgi:hypothetical protein
MITISTVMRDGIATTYHAASLFQPTSNETPGFVVIDCFLRTYEEVIKTREWITELISIRSQVLLSLEYGPNVIQ